MRIEVVGDIEYLDAINCIQEIFAIPGVECGEFGPPGAAPFYVYAEDNMDPLDILAMHEIAWVYGADIQIAYKDHQGNYSS